MIEKLMEWIEKEMNKKDGILTDKEIILIYNIEQKIKELAREKIEEIEKLERSMKATGSEEWLNSKKKELEKILK